MKNSPAMHNVAGLGERAGAFRLPGVGRGRSPSWCARGIPAPQRLSQLPEYLVRTGNKNNGPGGAYTGKVNHDGASRQNGLGNAPAIL